MEIGAKIRQARKEKGLSQEALAEHLGISVQAVSKWECELSCPDITLLPQIADFLEVSLDKLLRGDDYAGTACHTGELDLPDDDTLRIVQCIGQKIVSQEEWKKANQNEKIPLYFDEAWETRGNNCEVNIEIWGSAHIDGSVSGNVHAGDGVNCGNVGNDVNAGDGVNCGNIGNNVKAGDGVNCGNVGNNVSAGDSVNCAKVENNVKAGDSVTCGDVQGNVQCKGEIHCKTIAGDVKGGTIFYDE